MTPKRNIILEELMSIYDAETIMANVECGTYKNRKDMVITTKYTHHVELFRLLTKAGYTHDNRCSFILDGMVVVHLN